MTRQHLGVSRQRSRLTIITLFCPCISLRRLSSPRISFFVQMARAALQVFSFASSAHAVHAALLAMATVASLVDLRSSRYLTPVPVRVSVVGACRVTEVAPTTSKRRRQPLPSSTSAPGAGPGRPPSAALRGDRTKLRQMCPNTRLKPNSYGMPLMTFPSISSSLILTEKGLRSGRGSNSRVEKRAPALRMPTFSSIGKHFTRKVTE